ncbi:hypothetical protein NKG05_08640 [Oerskovia sp. M15]
MAAHRGDIEAAAAIVLAAAVVGMVGIIGGLPAGVRFRRLLRETWHPGEDPAPTRQQGDAAG